jgi:hypothetical protein
VCTTSGFFFSLLFEREFFPLNRPNRTHTNHFRMHHALLIGLNFYPKTGAGEWRPLRGCVRDILAIEAQLTKSHNGVQIRKLVASAAGAEPPRPAEDVECLPTYSNLTSGLQQIILDASAGDLVYIHFTGHGTAIEPTTPFASTGTGELALVVLASDDPTNKMQYLRGSELAYWMKAMVAADLKVTLVLDCCASGSVVRDKSDQSVRYLPYDHAIDVAYPPDAERSLGSNEQGKGIILAADRDASLRQNWMVNPMATPFSQHVALPKSPGRSTSTAAGTGRCPISW